MHNEYEKGTVTLHGHQFTGTVFPCCPLPSRLISRWVCKFGNEKLLGHCKFSGISVKCATTNDRSIPSLVIPMRTRNRRPTCNPCRCKLELNSEMRNCGTRLPKVVDSFSTIGAGLSPTGAYRGCVEDSITTIGGERG